MRDKEKNAEGKRKARLKPVEMLVMASFFFFLEVDEIDVTLQTLQYLQGTPAAKQTRASVTECLALLEPYHLTDVEKLQVVNLQPSSEVEVHLVRLLLLLFCFFSLSCFLSLRPPANKHGQLIEECAERSPFTERENVLELIQQLAALNAKHKDGNDAGSSAAVPPPPPSSLSSSAGFAVKGGMPPSPVRDSQKAASTKEAPKDEMRVSSEASSTAPPASSSPSAAGTTQSGTVRVAVLFLLLFLLFAHLLLP